MKSYTVYLNTIAIMLTVAENYGIFVGNETEDCITGRATAGHILYPGGQCELGKVHNLVKYFGLILNKVIVTNRRQYGHEITVSTSSICLSLTFDSKWKTRRLVNVRSHMIFRPELIYIFNLIVNQMKR